MAIQRTALRRTPLRAQPRSKGNRAEREIIDLLHAYGWKYARRNILSGGLGGADIVEGIPAVSIEVKHCERCDIWSWLAQCQAAAKPTDMPLLVMRRNRMRWWGCAPLDDMLELLRGCPRYTLIRSQDKTRVWNWIGETEADAPKVGLEMLPTVRFRRSTSGWYEAAPLTVILERLRERETA